MSIPKSEWIWHNGRLVKWDDATVHVTNLTSKNPRGYHISGYADKSVLHVSHCDLLDTRPGHNNSDGFIGAAGSTISDCFISTETMRSRRITTW